MKRSKSFCSPTNTVQQTRLACTHHSHSALPRLKEPSPLLSLLQSLISSRLPSATLPTLLSTPIANPPAATLQPPTRSLSPPTYPSKPLLHAILLPSSPLQSKNQTSPRSQDTFLFFVFECYSSSFYLMSSSSFILFRSSSKLLGNR